MYYYVDHTDMNGTTVRHILAVKDDGGITSFPDVDTNTGPDRQRYLTWVAEGNTAEPWQPESTTPTE
jgi:hypothetical protein